MGERLSSVFSPDGTLISASAAPHCKRGGGQKKKREDSKVESNDSPEIPDRGETSDIPGLPAEVILK